MKNLIGLILLFNLVLVGNAWSNPANPQSSFGLPEQLFEREPNEQWLVVSGWDNGKFGYCAAFSEHSKDFIQFGYNGRYWLVSIPSKQSSGLLGGVSIDDRNYTLEFRSRGNGWLATAIPGFDPNKNRDNIHLRIGGPPQTYDIHGLTPVWNKLAECVRKYGEVVPSPIDHSNLKSESIGTYCPKSGVFISPRTRREMSVTFVSKRGTKQGLALYWLDFDGQPVKVTDFENGRAPIKTYWGHNFIIKDADNTCHGDVFVVEKSGEIIVDTSTTPPSKVAPSADIAKEADISKSQIPDVTYPGAKTINTPKEFNFYPNTTLKAFAVADDPKTVSDWYKAEIPKHGWELVGKKPFDDGSGVYALWKQGQRMLWIVFLTYEAAISSASENFDLRDHMDKSQNAIFMHEGDTKAMRGFAEFFK